MEFVIPRSRLRRFSEMESSRHFGSLRGGAEVVFAAIDDILNSQG